MKMLAARPYQVQGVQGLLGIQVLQGVHGLLGVQGVQDLLCVQGVQGSRGPGFKGSRGGKIIEFARAKSSQQPKSRDFKNVV